jgi:hypothetical protein
MAILWCPRLAWQLKTTIHFPAVKRGLILELEAKKSLFEKS